METATVAVEKKYRYLRVPDRNGVLRKLLEQAALEHASRLHEYERDPIDLLRLLAVNAPASIVAIRPEPIITEDHQ